MGQVWGCITDILQVLEWDVKGTTKKHRRFNFSLILQLSVNLLGAENYQ